MTKDDTPHSVSPHSVSPHSGSPRKDSALYIVATPIGNLADISYRAIEVLKDVSIIAAEDTRHSAKLLQHYHISTPLIPYHDHSDDNQTRRLLEKLRNGDDVALISDAGTPLISDPGYKLVREAREHGFAVVPVPGACALIAALCASGMPSDRFAFEGFPPAKSAARKAVFDSVATETRSLIFYESPHRIMESLTDMAEVFGCGRNVVLARELTKSYETFLSGSLDNLLARLTDDPNQQRGEMVIIVEGYRADESADAIGAETEKAMKILLKELPVKKAAAIAAQLYGEKKNKLYKWALENGAGGE